MNQGNATEQIATSEQLLCVNDLADCIALDQASLKGLWTEQQWRNELSEPGRICIGLRQNGPLVAMASGWLVVDELQINVVAVDPTHQRRGLGTAVLTALIQQARQQGARSATLEVSPCNTGATALYERLGFTTSGTRRAYYSDGRDALIQWLKLD